MSDRPHFTAVQMAAALRSARGIKSAAAQALGCDWRTVDNYCKRYPSVQAAIDEQRERLVDVAEVHLTKWVDAGSERAVFWVLGTLGKERGYVGREEVTGKDGGPLEFSVSDARAQLLTEVQERRARIQALPRPVEDAEQEQSAS